jgi:hypothetical protein
MSHFRDVVVVTESEYDLQRDLCTVRKRLTNFYTSPKTWVGITGTVITNSAIFILQKYNSVITFVIMQISCNLLDLSLHCVWSHYSKYHIIGYNNNTTQYICEANLCFIGASHECRDLFDHLSNCQLLNEVTFHVFNYLGKKCAQNVGWGKNSAPLRILGR